MLLEALRLWPNKSESKFFSAKEEKRKKQEQKVIRSKWLWMDKAFYIHTQGICFSSKLVV
jgi:hypothetical protein